MTISDSVKANIKNTKIILCDCRKSICDAWESKFKEYPNVSICNKYFNECISELENNNINNSDIAIVSPANSYGLMDGGYDNAIINYFGRKLLLDVQNKIMEMYCGEQPICSSLPVNIIGYDNYVLIHTPTMRKPEIIRDYTIVYHCTRAAIMCAINQMCEIIVLPAFGGLCGQVPSNTVAFYMERAIAQLMNSPEDIPTWGYVCEEHPLSKVR